jgi:hypothetical protein
VTLLSQQRGKGYRLLGHPAMSQLNIMQDYVLNVLSRRLAFPERLTSRSPKRKGLMFELNTFSGKITK